MAFDPNGQALTIDGNCDWAATFDFVADADAMNGCTWDIGGNFTADGQTLNATATWYLYVDGTANARGMGEVEYCDASDGAGSTEIDASGAGLEDFTTYDETDPGNDITVAANTLTMVACSDHSWVSDDKGTDHFGDFVHRLRTKTVDGITSAVWLVANTADSFRNHYSAGQQAVALYWRAGPTLRLRDLKDASQDTTPNLSLNTEYWIEITRASTTYTVKIWDDDYDGNLVDTITTTGVATEFSIVHAYGSYEDKADLFVYNLALQEVWVDGGNNDNWNFGAAEPDPIPAGGVASFVMDIIG